MHSTRISPLLIVVSLASISLGLHPPLVVIARSSLEVILPRQTNPCTAACAPLQSSVNTCTTIDCLCTPAVAASLQDCVNCSVSNDPSVSVVSAAQSLIDTFTSKCSAVAGLPSVTIATGTIPSSLTTGNSTPLSTSAIIVTPTISQVIIRPSSTPSTPSATSTGSNTGTGLLPLQTNASPGRLVLHWTGALIGLAVMNILAF